MITLSIFHCIKFTKPLSNLDVVRRQPPFDVLVVEERRRGGLRHVQGSEAAPLAVVEDDRPIRKD
jgi:hypothetical protein